MIVKLKKVGRECTQSVGLIVGPTAATNESI